MLQRGCLLLKDAARGVMGSELPPGPRCTAAGIFPDVMGTWMGTVEGCCGNVCDHYCKTRSRGYISRELA